MSKSTLEVADIFRAYGKAWRSTHAGHISLAQLKVMSAIENCRTQALGGHLLRCESCEHELISYNSCRNRHCPKCQASSAKRWLEARQVELLPVDYYHLVFTLPQPLSELAYCNKTLMYGLLLQAAAETLLTIAADPKRLGAKLAVTFVLHTWGSALTHHPHVHGIVPGGGLSLDGERWIQCRSGYFLPVRVLSRLFRRLYLEKLYQQYAQLQFFSEHTDLREEESFRKWINVLKRIEWVVYAKKPFAGPKAVLAYLSRYTHRVAIANSRLIAADAETVSFRWKDYRLKGTQRYKVMSLATGQFIQRFLLHVLPRGFHRIRHYGFIANVRRKDNLARARELLAASEATADPISKLPAETAVQQDSAFYCPECGAPMIVMEILARKQQPRASPAWSGG